MISLLVEDRKWFGQIRRQQTSKKKNQNKTKRKSYDSCLLCIFNSHSKLNIKMMQIKNQYAITYQSKHRLCFLTAFCYVEKWSYQSSWCCLCALGLSGSGVRQGDLQPPPWRSSLPWGVRNKDPLLLVPILFSQDVALCRINWRKKEKNHNN